MNYSSYTRHNEHFTKQSPQLLDSTGICQYDTDFLITNTGLKGNGTFCMTCPPGATFDLGQGNCIDANGNSVQELNMYPVVLPKKRKITTIQPKIQNDEEEDTSGNDEEEEEEVKPKKKNKKKESTSSVWSFCVLS
jgi:hypothetical protein